MAISFKWSITKLRVIPQYSGKSNVVCEAEWLVSGTDDVNNITKAMSGLRGFVLGNAFTPFDQLTEAQILDWCFAPEVTTWTDMDNVKQATTKHLKEDGEAQVAGQIARQLAQKESEPALPWAKVAPAPESVA
jgi:hypothetical protein